MTSTSEPDTLSLTPSRRKFLAWSGAIGAAGMVGLPGCTLQHSDPADAPLGGAEEGERIVWNACLVNCGSRCPVRMAVRDGRVIRIEPDNTGDDDLGNQQIRACVCGRSIRQRMYSPERLKKPLKRVGKRGEGKWEEISWDEATTIVADKIKELISKYGNESIYHNYGTGVIGAAVARSWPPGNTAVARLMNCVGGFLSHYNDYSAGNIEAAVDFHYGAWMGNNSNDDTVNSKLVVMFGNNPHETRMSGGGEMFVTQKAKQLSGHKVIVVDPRFSDTAMNLADEWVAIRPGTDLAFVAGMAHVMISEGLHDQEFLDKYCSGFDEEHLPENAPPGSSYRSYIEGKGEDGIEKTPEWAAKITGVPANDIRRLAREIAMTKPCNINQGWGIQRHSNGESQARAPMLLSNLIGQVGIPGGGNGEREGANPLPLVLFPTLENPVRPTISFYMWTKAITDGKGMTYRDGVRDSLDTNSNSNVVNDVVLGSNIKMIWNYGSNALINQHGDINHTIELLSDESKVEMIVVIDNQMTVSARYADIVLPDAMASGETIDLAWQSAATAGNLGYLIFCDKAHEPLYDSKPVYEMLTEIADKLGVREKFTEGRTQEDWVRWMLDETRKKIPDLPSFEELRAEGIYRQNVGPYISMAKFREDPVANPLETPSGKIEIYSSNLARMRDDWNYDQGSQWIDPLPVYRQTRELPGDALQLRYPLQCIGHHYKQRTHSSYGNSPWLKEAHPQLVWINKIDADARGIATNDQVRVFNDRGATELPAFVTERIAPGVVSVPQGAWYAPSASDGVDKGGCVNVLTSQQLNAYSKGNGQHSALVQIEKV